MARTTLMMKTLAHSPKKRKHPGDLDNVESRRVLDLFEKFCRTVHRDRLVNHKKQHYFRIEKVHRYGRMVLVEMESGLFGNPGVTRRVTDHKPTHSRGEDEAANFHTRVAFVVSPNAAKGVFLIEKEGVPVAGNRVVDLFREALMRSFDSSYFPVETVVAADAWLEYADMSRIEVRSTKWKTTLSGEAKPHTLEGQLSHELRPLQGQGVFPTKVRKSVLDGDLDPRGLLSFDDGESQDDFEAIVEMTKDGQKKSFVLGDEKTPHLQIRLTEGTQRRLSLEEIRSLMFTEAAEYYDREGLTWDESWRQDTLGADDDEWNHEYQSAEASDDD